MYTIRSFQYKTPYNSFLNVLYCMSKMSFSVFIQHWNWTRLLGYTLKQCSSIMDVALKLYFSFRYLRKIKQSFRLEYLSKNNTFFWKETEFENKNKTETETDSQKQKIQIFKAKRAKTEPLTL